MQDEKIFLFPPHLSDSVITQSNKSSLETQMKMEEERERFQGRSWEGACVSVEAQPRRESKRATEAPLLVGPSWPLVSVAVPDSSPLAIPPALACARCSLQPQAVRSRGCVSAL